MKTLKGKEIYSGIILDRTPRNTRVSAKQPESRIYFRAFYDRVGFTVDQAFVDDYVAGNIVELTLSDAEVERDSVTNPGTTETVKTLAYSGHATKQQLLNMASFDREIKMLENPELNTVAVDDLLIAKLQKAIAASAVTA
jgi:hypothetical protein